MTFRMTCAASNGGTIRSRLESLQALESICRSELGSKRNIQKDFETISFDMYTVYLNVGFGYAF